MAQKARLLSVAHAVPEFILDQADVQRRAKLLYQDRIQFERYEPIFKNTTIEKRHSVVPIEWFLKDHDLREKNNIYIDESLKLIQTAALNCLHKIDFPIEKVDEIVVASTTGVATPSLDARLMEKLPFRRDIQRTPLFGLGCAGGVMGLGRSARLAESRPGKFILFCVVELCTLTFQKDVTSKTNIVASSLFGDGAAAALISTHGDGPEIVDQQEFTFSESLNVMGWDVQNDGFHVVFSRSIPRLVETQLRPRVDEFLTNLKIPSEKVDRYLCHPGGIKVIEAIEKVLNLNDRKLVESRDILKNYGNMSAATVLFVLEQALDKKGMEPQEHWMLSALGPGFTSALLMLKGT